MTILIQDDHDLFYGESKRTDDFASLEAAVQFHKPHELVEVVGLEDVLSVWSREADRALRVDDVVNQLSRNAKGDVASSRYMHPSILGDLANDTELHVLHALTDNTSIPDVIKEKLAKSTDKWVGLKLIRQHHQIPHKARASLATHPDEEVRMALVNDKSTPADILLLLAQEPTYAVSMALVRNKNTPAEALLLLADTDSSNILSYIHKHINATPAVMQKWRESSQKILG